jgi:hypothetical protein
MNVIIPVGRPTWQCDLYSITAKAVWHTLREILAAFLNNISALWNTTENNVYDNIQISIHVPPGFLKEMVDCELVAHVKTLRYEFFVVANLPSDRL